MNNEKVYYEPAWEFVPHLHELRFYPDGYYPAGEQREPKKIIKGQEINLLIKALDREGLIKPTLDDKVRKEDLKITHRLLDIMEEKL